MFRLVVAGGRDFNNYIDAENILKSVLRKKQLEEIQIISGGASGADRIGELFAMKFKLKLRIVEADWKQYGKRAGMLRNRKMAEESDATILFWDGSSKGTANMRMETLRENNPLFVVYYDKSTMKIIECKDESNPF